ALDRPCDPAAPTGPEDLRLATHAASTSGPRSPVRPGGTNRAGGSAPGPSVPAFQDAHEVLLQTRPRRRVPEHPAAAARDLLERLADAHEPRHHHRVR